MISIVIKIGAAKTLSVEGWEIIPDDRQMVYETIGGVVVQDFGHVEEGDNYSCTVRLRGSDFEIIKNYWNTRTFVDVIDEGGNVYPNMRVVVKKYSHIPYFSNNYEVSLEFWRV